MGLQALLGDEAQVLGGSPSLASTTAAGGASSRCSAFSTGSSFLHTGQVGDRKNTSVDLGPGVHHQGAHGGNAFVEHADLAGQGKETHEGGQNRDPQQDVRNHQGFVHDQFLS
jgi:hypothetical protein